MDECKTQQAKEHAAVRMLAMVNIIVGLIISMCIGTFLLYFVPTMQRSGEQLRVNYEEIREVHKLADDLKSMLKNAKTALDERQKQ